MKAQAEVDQRNAEFWNTLCGSSLAQSLGITDGSAQSLRKFDEWYLGYYPYLLQHVPVRSMGGLDVLEIGLGYGTLSQQIAMAGARYRGLDIASAPVGMVNARMAHIGADPESAIQGSMLQCPFPDESFDCVVSIGCFHHTGNTQRCLDETWRVLRPGGRAYLMVYNRFSYRQWRHHPRQTIAALWAQWTGTHGMPEATEAQRAAYDTDLQGRAAPETEFFSIPQIHSMMRRYARLECVKENCEDLAVRGRRLVAREKLLGIVGRTAGLDIYISATK